MELIVKLNAMWHKNMSMKNGRMDSGTIHEEKKGKYVKEMWIIVSKEMYL